MTKIKLVLIGLLLLLCSGCRAEYELEFDHNLVMKEVVTLRETNDTIITYAPSVNEFIRTMMVNLETENILKGQRVKTAIGDEITTATGQIQYYNFDDYLRDNLLINNLVETMSLTRHQELVTLDFKVDKSAFEETELYNPLFTQGEIKIIVPFVVLSHNADRYDEATNTYTWSYHGGAELKDINVIFDAEQFLTSSIKERVGITLNKHQSSVIIVISVIILVLGSLFGLWLLLKQRQNNVI